MGRRSAWFGRGSQFCIWWKDSGFQAVDRKGICFGSRLEEESARGAAEDEERTGVRRGEWRAV